MVLPGCFKKFGVFAVRMSQLVRYCVVGCDEPRSRSPFSYFLCLKLTDILLFISANHDNISIVPWLVYRTCK